MDLRERIVNRPYISSDAFTPYPETIERAYGADCDYGQIIKQYAGEPEPDAAPRYSPGWVVGATKRTVVGKPRRKAISTSNVERQNLTLPMQQCRFTRLTNGFSKKLANHKAAVALYFMHYDLLLIPCGRAAQRERAGPY